MKAKRFVSVESFGDAWVVKYILRAPGQRYWAAQFDKRMRSRAEVEKWVQNNPKLELVRPGGLIKSVDTAAGS